MPAADVPGPKPFIPRFPTIPDRDDDDLIRFEAIPCEIQTGCKADRPFPERLGHIFQGSADFRMRAEMHRPSSNGGYRWVSGVRVVWDGDCVQAGPETCRSGSVLIWGVR
jgi:hypothetical protein